MQPVPAPMSWTYCLTPAASEMTVEAYPEPLPAPPGTAHFQMVSPVFLLRATRVASLPPGVQISLSPSTRGDSQYFQLGTDPPKSFVKLFCHSTLPSAASTQTMSPRGPTAKTSSPSTVGVLLGASPVEAPTGVAHSGSPFSPLRAITYT